MVTYIKHSLTAFIFAFLFRCLGNRKERKRTLTLKPSLSMKTLSTNNFTLKLLNKLLSDLSIGVHLESSF